MTESLKHMSADVGQASEATEGVDREVRSGVRFSEQDAREARLARIRSQLSAGSYRIGSEQIAQKLMDDLAVDVPEALNARKHPQAEQKGPCSKS